MFDFNGSRALSSDYAKRFRLPGQRIAGLFSYRNGSGDLRAKISLPQINLAQDSLLDRTACNIGFGGLTGALGESEIWAEWFCPVDSHSVAAVTYNHIGDGGLYYFSRPLSALRSRQLFAWVLENGVAYRWGDADQSGEVDVSDVVFIIRFVFSGGAPPALPNAADANGDGAVDVSDAVYLISYIFADGPAPLAGRVS